MTTDQKFFIEILADFIHGKITMPDVSDLNWNKIVYYAETQALMGLVYYQTRDFFSQHPDLMSQTVARLHKGFLSDIYLYTNRNRELNELVRQCKDIPMILMKGSVVQEYYPEPIFRSMGDIDIVVHAEDRNKIDAFLLSEGYTKMVNNHAVWNYNKNYIEFEIHEHMFYEYLANKVDYKGYFDQSWKHVRLANGEKNTYLPDDNFHFIFLITHLAKHITNNGMGFRAFLDLVFMTQKVGKNMDWNWIQKELEKLQLLQFTKICFTFCHRWFHVQMPLEYVMLDENFYEEVTVKMFHDGIFGLENQQNDGAHAAKEIKRSRNQYWFGAIKYTIRQLFPSYRDMQLAPWYSFLDGRPWLLPVAWVYRWFYTATHKFEHSKNLLIEPYKKRKMIEKREKLINSWGL